MLSTPTPLSESLERGATLPASWYSDPAILALEREHVLARSWQYVGRADGLSEHGSFFAGRAGHVPVVVVRDGNDLRGFVNVCRHRGHLVAQGEGRRDTLQCPYHAWTYGLDGCLRGAPRSAREPGFDRTGLGLLPVSVDMWGSLVFVNPDPEAAPLAEALGPLPGHLREGGIDLGGLRFHRRIEWAFPVNWKNALENYLECYHCPVAHPGFSQLIDVGPDAYALRADGLVLSQLAHRREGADGLRGEIEQAQYHLLFPTTTFNLEPGPPNLGIDVWLPTTPDRMAGFTDYFFGEEVSEADAEAVIAFGQQVAAEDADLVAGVQAGLDSGAVPQGRLLPESEQLIARFQRLLHDAVAG